jgi:hypothetical protein
MKRLVFLGGVVCLIGSTFLTGCGSSVEGPREKSGLVGAWTGRGGSQLVYKSDGTVADVVSGRPTTTGTYDVERSGSHWVEIYTDAKGKTTRHFFTVSADKLRVYFSFEDAKSGDVAAATYLRTR